MVFLMEIGSRPGAGRFGRDELRQTPFLEVAGQPLLPVTEMLTDQIISIPVYPNLTDEEVGTIIGAVNQVAEEIGERLPSE